MFVLDAVGFRVDMKKPPTVDDGSLFAMMKMSCSREGRLAVGFVMARKFTLYLIEAVQLGARHEVVQIL